MNKNVEELRNIDLELEGLKARKDAIKKKLAEHRDAITDADNAEARAIKEKETELQARKAELQKEAEKENENKNRSKIMDFEKMERCDVLASKEYRNAFFKKLQGKALSEDETRSISSASTSGGAAIPTETMNEIIGQLTQSNSTLDLITVLNIPELLSIPKENVTNDASWVAEDADSTVSDDTLTSISLSTYKLIRTIRVTAKLQAMAVSAFETWVVNTMVKKMRAALDKAIYSGTGTNQPTGLDGQAWGTTNSITIAAAASITYDNLVDLEALVDETFINNAVWTMNRKTLASIMKIKDDSKRPVFERAIEDGFRGYILGIPVLLDRNVKDGEAYLGDFKSGYIMNFAQAIELASSKEAGFMSGATVYRGLALVDGKPTGVSGAIVKFVKTTTAG